MVHCDTHNCPGHTGWKYLTCLDEALHGISLDGMAVTTGTVEFQGHLSLLTFPAAETLPFDGYSVRVPAGAYLVHEDNDGRVSVTHHTPDDAQVLYARFDAAYGQWLNTEDGDAA
jgi:hypothetical protein